MAPTIENHYTRKKETISLQNLENIMSSTLLQTYLYVVLIFRMVILKYQFEDIWCARLPPQNFTSSGSSHQTTSLCSRQEPTVWNRIIIWYILSNTYS